MENRAQHSSEPQYTNQSVDGPVSHRVLVERLGQGWKPGHSDVARDLVSRWKRATGCSVRFREVGDGWITFDSDLREIRLRWSDRVPCLVMGGNSQEMREALADLLKLSDRVVFLFALSAEARVAAAEAKFSRARRRW